MLYALEMTSMRKTKEKKLDIEKMKMLRWMPGVIKLNRNRNENISESLTFI